MRREIKLERERWGEKVLSVWRDVSQSHFYFLYANINTPQYAPPVQILALKYYKAPWENTFLEPCPINQWQHIRSKPMTHLYPKKCNLEELYRAK